MAATSLVEPLLAWYDANARVLPWRESRDPYRVWVSEIMLQQTRVETVVPYFQRWMARFPDVRALANADLDDVLKAWEGLGYYSRARNLHRAARIVVEELGGRLPSDPARLRTLPGVGDYTAGAVASIAFGVPVPAVDGNARRVLCRWFDVDADISTLRARAAEIVPESRPGDFNQAVMELGATLCTPRSPDCGRCPVAEACQARVRGTVAQRPAARAHKTIPEYDVAVAVIRAEDGRVLLVRNPADALLGGLWAFPATPIHAGEEVATAARGLAAMFLGATSSAVTERMLPAVPHVFTHRRVRYHPVVLTVPVVTGAASQATSLLRETTSSPYAESRWVTPPEAARLALPVAQRKILRLAAQVG